MDGTIRWRIYYLDGRTVDSREATWVQAPSDRIVAIVHQYDQFPVRVELGTPYYLHEQNYVIRVWDPTLYLRRMGTVKFGRWAAPNIFDGAWREALSQVIAAPAQIEDAMKGAIVAGTRIARPDEVQRSWGLWYDDMTRAEGSLADESWLTAPSDGVMAAISRHVTNGIVLSVAIRRYTFYYWQRGELINTDDLEQVMSAHPQFKRGCPAFTGGDYLGQASTIKAALEDTLEDLS